MDIKNFILGIAIIILSIFVVVYGFNSFYPSPEFDDFCDNQVKEADTKAECEAMDGKWETFAEPLKDSDRTGYCNFNYHCSQDYDVAREKHSLNRFLISIPLAVLIIALGAVLFKLDAVGGGLMGGGVGTLLFGIGGYWNYANNWFRFVVSLVGLIALIWFAYWFNEKAKKNSKGKKKSKKSRREK